LPTLSRALVPFWFIFALSRPNGAWAQMPRADPTDVGTIEGIVHAYYDVVNGPAGVPRQWRRDSTLYMPGATFVAMQERDGKPAPDIVTPEQFRRAVDRWWISSAVWDDARPSGRIRESWVGRRERVA
jgi:hypothetical protein